MSTAKTVLIVLLWCASCIMLGMLWGAYEERTENKMRSELEPSWGPRIVTTQITAVSALDDEFGDYLFFTVDKPIDWDVSPLKIIELSRAQVYHSDTCWGWKGMEQDLINLRGGR